MIKNIGLYILLGVGIVLLAVVLVQFARHAGDTCNYNNPNKSYINKNSSCMINFMCTQGHRAFRDECGCGCNT